MESGRTGAKSPGTRTPATRPVLSSLRAKRPVGTRVDRREASAAVAGLPSLFGSDMAYPSVGGRRRRG
jgi:hypothetical protein